MRSSILIVAAIVAIAIAASLDALRGGSESVPRTARANKTTTEPTTSERTPNPAEVLSRAGVTGTLYFTLQVGDACVLHTLDLPGLADASAFLIDRCEFDVSPEGTIVTGPACPGKRVEVIPVGGPAQLVRGCSPAWKPDGELTVVRNGNVANAEGEILVRDIARIGRTWFSERKPVTVRALAWMTETRVMAILAGRSPHGAELLVFAESGRTSIGSDVAVGARHYVDRPLQQLWIAQPGDDLSAPGIGVHTRTGTFVRTANFQANVNGFAALHERWYALARPDNVCIYERRDPPPREEFPLTCLPFDAVDVAWV